MFALVVDDFGVQYTDKADVATSSPRFRPTTNTPQIGKALCGIHLKWDYRLAVDLSMPGYVRKPYSDLLIPINQCPQQWTEPNYGAKQRFAVTTPTAQPFQPRPQAPRSSAPPFYCRAIDLTMHVAQHHRRSQAETTGSPWTLSPSCSTTAPHILTPSYATDAAA
jgi:hypothetical protein